MDLTAVGAHPDDFDQVNKATPFCDRHRAFRILAGKDVEEMSALLLFLIRRILQLFDDARDVCDGLFRRQLLDPAFTDPHDTAGLSRAAAKIALFPKALVRVPKVVHVGFGKFRNDDKITARSRSFAHRMKFALRAYKLKDTYLTLPVTRIFSRASSQKGVVPSATTGGSFCGAQE